MQFKANGVLLQIVKNRKFRIVRKRVFAGKANGVCAFFVGQKHQFKRGRFRHVVQVLDFAAPAFAHARTQGAGAYLCKAE